MCFHPFCPKPAIYLPKHFPTPKLSFGEGWVRGVPGPFRTTIFFPSKKDRGYKNTHLGFPLPPTLCVSQLTFKNHYSFSDFTLSYKRAILPLLFHGLTMSFYLWYHYDRHHLLFGR
ncbi:hypothetical protein CEXT_527951 [Caerostris extrusa]|uniref:Uncharacterized protein n=1 Tax=Caerostris extrusa TaxID=172846 RepID=A0AAV4XAL0_CAEEX|nr:hypothetical protein CEXT_527951 [Caerostris extrusa]